jgi:hypothetical protein
VRGWRTLGWLAAAMTLVAPGCWLQSGYDARRSGNNAGETTITAANVASLAKAWEVPGATAAGDPVVNGGTAYVSNGTAVEARALATGAVRWRAPVAHTRSLAVAGGHLWSAAADTGCALTALDRATGATVAAQSFGGNAFDFGSDGRSYCTVTEVLATGNSVMTSWSYLAGARAPGACFPGFTYQTGAGTITLDSATGEVTSQTGGVGSPGCGPVPTGPANTLSSDGTVVYMPAGNQIERFGTCGGSPCGPLALPAGMSASSTVVPAAGGRLVLTAPDQLVVLDAATGAVQWSAPFSTPQFAAPAVTGTTIYLTGTGGVVAAFPLTGCGAATCDPSWTDTSSGEVSGSARVGGNLVYVAGGQGNEVRAYAAGGCGAATCAPLATVELGGPSYISPVVDSATLFVQEGGAVAAYRLP